MINVTIREQDDYITGFEISGHSNYAEHGKDIICAAVSAISQALIIGLEYIDTDIQSSMEEARGYLDVTIDKEFYNDNSTQLLLKVMELSLKEIEEQYAEYINVEYKEV